MCPACQRLIVYLIAGRWLGQGNGANLLEVVHRELVRPRACNRPPLSAEVPACFAEVYKEACLVLDLSPKASAALSRRCLQHLLREKAAVKPGNLSGEIQQVLDSHSLPSYLADSLDAVRNIGNSAAHPMKGEHTGEILDVEPQEAEWNLDILEGLFDFYFTQPALMERKKDALNKKLDEAGKPPLKEGNPESVA